MKISELKDIIEVEHKVVRDGEFNTTGFYNRFHREEDLRIGFVRDENFLMKMKAEGFACIICSGDLKTFAVKNFHGGIICCEEQNIMFREIHNYIADNMMEKRPNEIAKTAIVHTSAHIAPHNVRIGENVEIMAGAVIKEGVTIGDDSKVMEGSIIGMPPLYYIGEGSERKSLKAQGGTWIGKNTCIHGNTVISSAVVASDTFVGDNAVIDSCCFLAHDVRIEDNCTVAAGAKFAGWAKVGRNTFVGVGCSVAPNVNVGENCKLSIGSVVTKDVENNKQVSGNFAIDHSIFIENLKKQSK